MLNDSRGTIGKAISSGILKERPGLEVCRAPQGQL
jgi:hypothetical protein